MMEEPSWIAAKLAILRQTASGRGIPPFVKLGALVLAGIAPFAIFVAFQATSPDGTSGPPDLEPQEQLPVDQRVPLAFPFGTPEPSPEPSPTESTGSTTTTFAGAPTSTSPRQCANGRDDDGDNRVDLRDPGCSSAADNTERDPAPTTTRKLPPPTTVPVTAPPTTVPVTIPPTVPTTVAPGPTTTRTTRVVLGECSDGIDNDRDGKTDLEDQASCHGDPADDEGVPPKED